MLTSTLFSYQDVLVASLCCTSKTIYSTCTLLLEATILNSSYDCWQFPTADVNFFCLTAFEREIARTLQCCLASCNTHFLKLAKLVGSQFVLGTFISWKLYKCSQILITQTLIFTILARWLLRPLWTQVINLWLYFDLTCCDLIAQGHVRFQKKIVRET